MKKIAEFIFKLTGWKATGDIPEDLSKAVLIIAPHTSNLDFFIGRLYCFMKRIPIRVLIKKESFFWPIGGLLKKLGGVPIDRKVSESRVGQINTLFQENDPFFFAITPEGTRSRSDKWKGGFYYIALQAKVPVLLCYIDYKTKEAGVGPPYYPSGDFEHDMKEIEDFYRGRIGRHPEKFNL